jgi:hypothetical protein
MNDERRRAEPVYVRSESTGPSLTVHFVRIILTKTCLVQGDVGYHNQLDARCSDGLSSHSSVNDIRKDDSPHPFDYDMSSPDLPQSTVDADRTPSPPIRPHSDPSCFNESPSEDQRRSRVHFRSRVRIASGIHRHRPGSLSVSPSPSSSISASLRSQTDLSSSTLGPLGQRTHILSRGRDTSSHLGAWRKSNSGIPRERSPLKNCSPYVDMDDHRYYTIDGQEILGMEMDEIFGKWPKRMLNPQVKLFFLH